MAVKYVPPPEVIKDAWKSFVEMRTKAVAKRLHKKLQKEAKR